MSERVTGAQAVAACLAEAGVTAVYGVPGEHCLAIVDALDRSQDLDFVSVRHESAAAMMAEAHAKLTGGLGACLGTASVGAVNLMSGLNVAQHDSTPVVAVIGQVDGRLRGRDAWQELDIVQLFRGLTKHAVEIADAGRLPELFLQALALARAGRSGPVAVSVPVDVQVAAAGPLASGLFGCERPGMAVSQADAVLTLLASAERPLVVAGGGVLASGARAALVALAERVGLPVATAFRRPDAFPNDHPHYVGPLGLGARPVTRRLALDADLLLVLGCR